MDEKSTWSPTWRTMDKVVSPNFRQAYLQEVGCQPKTSTLSCVLVQVGAYDSHGSSPTSLTHHGYLLYLSPRHPINTPHLGLTSQFNSIYRLHHSTPTWWIPPLNTTSFRCPACTLTHLGSVVSHFIRSQWKLPLCLCLLMPKHL